MRVPRFGNSRIGKGSTAVITRRRLKRVQILFGLFCIALFGTGLTVAPIANAAVGINHNINFQGKLTNPDGTNIANGSYGFVFSLYSAATGGTAIWTETDSLALTDGVFQVNLGAAATGANANFGNVDFNSDSLYLGIKVGADAEMSPRVQFTATPYAFNSEKLGGITAAGFAQLNPASAQTGSLNVSGSVQAATSLQAPLVDTATAVALNIGTATATSVKIGQSANPVTIQGNSSSTFTATSGGFTTTVGFTAPTQPNSINFPNAGGTICTTTVSTCSATYQTAGNYLQKNAVDTSAVSASGYLLGLTNSSSTAAGVLSLSNSGTNAALSVMQSSNPSIGQALILANNSNATPSGNLISLQVGGVNEFSVDTTGAVTSGTVNGQTISVAANFTGTVTSANTVSVTAGGIAVTGNSTITGTLGGLTGLTVASGGASITGGVNNNSGGVTNAGAIAGATTIAASSSVTGGSFDAATASGLILGGTNATGVTLGKSGVGTAAFGINNNSLGLTNTGSVAGATTIAANNTLTLSGSGANELAVTGAPAASATSSLLQIGSPIAGGNAAVNGGTYLGANIPTTGAGSAADLLNFQAGGAYKLKASSAGLLDAVGGFAVNGVNGSSIAACAAGQYVNGFATAGGIVTGGACSNMPASMSANQQLSNLSGTVAINLSLTPGVTNAVDLGSSTLAFRNAYVGTSVLAPTFDALAAGALNLGTSTATGITLGKAGVGTQTFGINNNASGITNAGAVGGATTIALNGTISGGTTYTASTAVQAPSFDTPSAVAMTIGGTNASSVTLGKATTAFTVQGTSASVLTATSGTSTTTVGFTAPTAANSILFPNAGGTLCTTTASTCSSTYAVANVSGYLAKNAADTSSAAVAGNLLAFTNTSTGAAGVLSLANSGTNSALVVSSAANPAAGQAVISVNNSNAAPSGNLFQLQTGGVNKFAVDFNGAVTSAAINGQTISSAANFTGTVTSASALTVSAGGISVTGNSTINGTLGGLTGLTVASGGESISGGSNMNNGGITSVGAISGSTGLTFAATSAIDTATTALAINIGTTNASGVTVGRTAGSLLLQGNGGTSLTATVAGITNSLAFATPAGSNHTLTLPNETGTVCSTASICNGYAPASSSGAYIALAPAAAQTDATTNPSVYINKTATGSLVTLQAAASTVFSIQSNGNLTSTGIASLASGVLTANQTTFQVKMGGGTPTIAAPTAAGSGSLYVTNVAEVAGQLYVGNVGNGITVSSASGNAYEPTLSGTARHQKYIRLNAEYAGAVLDASGTANTGTMTAAFDATQRFGFYKWTTGQSTAQSYDVVATVPLPDDWAGWNGNPTFKDYISAAGPTATLTITRTDGTIDPNFNAIAITPGTAAAWNAFNTVAFSGVAGTNYVAGGTMTIRVRLAATSGTDIRLADILLPYYSKY